MTRLPESCTYPHFGETSALPLASIFRCFWMTHRSLEESMMYEAEEANMPTSKLPGPFVLSVEPGMVVKPTFWGDFVEMTQASLCRAWVGASVTTLSCMIMQQKPGELQFLLCLWRVRLECPGLRGTPWPCQCKLGTYGGCLQRAP